MCINHIQRVQKISGSLIKQGFSCLIILDGRIMKETEYNDKYNKTIKQYIFSINSKQFLTNIQNILLFLFSF